MQIGILVTGSEILDGRVAETNSHYLIQALTDAGFEVKHVLSSNDDLNSIIAGLEFLASRVSIAIISGGMGPTADDLTRESVAKFSGCRLLHNMEVQKQIEEFFKRRGRKFDPSNAKQALFPDGARVIPNPAGSAPGFHLIYQSLEIFALPGIPSELKILTENYILPSLSDKRSKLAFKPLNTVLFRVFGLSEAVVGSRVAQCGLPNEIQVAYQARFPEILVALKSRNYGLDLQLYAEQARNAVGSEFVFSTGIDQDLPDILKQLLIESKGTLAVAESCTGGLLGKLLTGVSGSSQYFLGGVISYSDELKQSLLGIEPKLLSDFGAVSAETAAAMASGVQSLCGASHALSITGIAGPLGGSDEKPVGTFYVGVSSQQSKFVLKCFFPSDRERIRIFAAWTAMDALRRLLVGQAQIFPQV